MHEEASDRVLGGGDQHRLARLDPRWLDHIDVVGDRPLHAVFERLGARQLAVDAESAHGERTDQSLFDRDADVKHVLDVALVVTGVVGREGVHRRRWRIVGASPEFELLLAVLGAGPLLGETGERAVHALVEPPRLVDGRPEAVDLGQHEPGSLDRAREPRGVDHVEEEAVRSEQLPCLGGFLPALGRERRVLPTSEEAELVVLRLAMADDDQRLDDGRLGLWCSRRRGEGGKRRRGSGAESGRGKGVGGVGFEAGQSSLTVREVVVCSAARVRAQLLRVPFKVNADGGADRGRVGLEAWQVARLR
mmetsp:Transcript_35384/g.75577  ORF Transcript_35384/g.75577 Transcript_35384/m.75577 type:complete len:306 (-) Transcript_35384:575-1492(-)